MDRSESNEVYPNCISIVRTVRIGGMGKQALVQEMESRGMKLNEAGLALFSHPSFTAMEASSNVSTIELTVANLGFNNGALFSDIAEKSVSMGLSACPLELGPHLRLQLLDQEEGQIGKPSTQHRAPPGSITVFSSVIEQDERTPQGFYLRRINGVLWLRGYRSGPEHVWSPDDHLVFVAPFK